MGPDGIHITPTREVFDNILPWMQWVFYALILSSVAAVGWQVLNRFRYWNVGTPGGFERDWRVWARRLVTYGLAQKRVHKKSLGGLLHLLLFSGFLVLTIGTTLLAIADQGPVNFHKGWYFLIYEVVMDTFGIALCLGCLLAFYRRAFQRPASLGHEWRDYALLGVLLALGITGFVVEGLRLHYNNVPHAVASWSPVGQWLRQSAFASLSVPAARSAHLALWWLHAVLVAALFLLIPVSRFLHILTAPVNIATRPSRHPGALAALSLEEVEKSGRIGVSTVGHLSRQQLLSLDACMECGRCEDACPAWATRKPLSPKALVRDLRRAMPSGPATSLHDGRIAPETLWSCTMCQACVQECPVLIGHVDLVSDMRRHLVSEGEITGPPAKAMAAIGKQGNPFGRPASDRTAWASGLDVPTVESNPNYEYLLWVGCAAAYDPRAQKVARATAQLLQRAKVNFAILGKSERCTGDPARRLGDEFLFQDSARSNVEALNSSRCRKIVTPCPHCFNTLKNEYPQFEGHYEVHHHSQILSDLVREKRLHPQASGDASVTLHDPCYLARVNGESESTRSIVRSTTHAPLREMPRNREKTFCCGAGGGRMFFDENPQQRVSLQRATEALATGARTIATACPFCLNMMTDAVAGTPNGSSAQVLDVAEILLAAQPAATAAASADTKPLPAAPAP